MCCALRPIYNPDAILYSPVDPDNTTGNLRLVMTREEIDRLINDMPEIKSTLQDNERERGKEFHSRLRACHSRARLGWGAPRWKRRSWGRETRWWMPVGRRSGRISRPPGFGRNCRSPLDPIRRMILPLGPFDR